LNSRLSLREIRARGSGIQARLLSYLARESGHPRVSLTGKSNKPNLGRRQNNASLFQEGSIMTIQQINILCYLSFWAVFVLGMAVTFKLTASAMVFLDKELPGGCPPMLRLLTWLLAGSWSIAMLSEGILRSEPYFRAAF